MMKRIITILAATAVMLSSGAVAVFAAETDVNDSTEIRLEEDATAGEELTSLPQEEESNALTETDGEITAVEAPDKADYSFGFRPALEELLSQFPDTLTVRIGGKTEKINVSWVCEQDYNKILDEYSFVPDLKGYTVSNGVELPKLIVACENELPDIVAGFVPIKTDYEVPFVTEAGNALSDSSLPDYFNSYKDNKLPKVRDQLMTQSCWAHSMIGAMEADLIHDKQAKTDIDLSEMQLAYYFRNSADPKKCRKDTVTRTGEGTYLSEGALPTLAARLMSNLIGAIPDKEAPLDNDPDSYKPGIEDAVSKDTAQLRNAYFINAKDRMGIKKAVMEHGGVSIGFYAETQSLEALEKIYNAVNNAYYCDDDNARANHGVMIVGWDDKFPSTNFSSKPEGDGAWLIRNSWGDDKYGYKGYFWMSYYDKSFANSGMPVVAIDADTNVFNNCYAYDGMPFSDMELNSDAVSYYKMTSDDTFSVTYDVAAHEAVKGVGFELETTNASVNICAKNLSTGQSVATLVKTGAAGVYTAVFDEPLEVFDKSTVRVSINGISDDGKYIGLGFEESSEPIPYMSFTFKGVVDRGYKLNGKKYNNSDLRVKLYTDKSNAKYKKVTGVKLNKNTATTRAGKTLKLKATVSPAKASIKDVTWKSSNEKVAVVDENGVVTAVKKGSATITATTVDGKKKASCKLTVKDPIKVKSVSLNLTKKGIKVGKTYTLKAVIKPDNATIKDVTWKSSNKKVATVSKDGKVKGIKEGKATITVTTKDGKKTAKCKVTVKKK